MSLSFGVISGQDKVDVLTYQLPLFQTAVLCRYYPTTLEQHYDDRRRAYQARFPLMYYPLSYPYNNDIYKQKGLPQW